MAKYDERGVIIPAPVQGHLGGERYDDEHRGPAVTEAYSLSRCWIDLAEHSRNWPEPDSISNHLKAISQNHPPESRDGWLKDAANREVMEKLLSYALRSGELPLWVAPLDGPEKPVPAESILEMDHATMVSGTYRPPNDRGWLHGRPLFIKWSDWVKFVAKANAEKEFPPASRMSDEAKAFAVDRVFKRDDPAPIAPWWSINQTLAWITTRIPAYVEYIGNLETDEPREHRPYIVHAICESQVAESDEGQAFLEARRASWPAGSFLAHAGRALLEKILAGAVRPMTRENGQGRQMRQEDFVGIGAKETGGDWLDLEPQPLFASADIMRTFPALELGPDGNGKGKVPANRQLNHEKIIERAETLRKENSGISLTSTAASIRAELPPNPKTGKPRDQRGIEKIIAHLWEGKA